MEKIFDSELKVLKILWEKGAVPAKQIAEELNVQTGWSVTTTYTVIKRSIEKGYIERTDPQFVCRALITEQEVINNETTDFVDKFFGGSVDKLFASIVGKTSLSAEEIERLTKLIEGIK